MLKLIQLSHSSLLYLFFYLTLFELNVTVKFLNLFYHRLGTMPGKYTNCFQNNIQISSKNIGPKDNLQASWDDCALSCQDVPGCSYWNFEKPGSSNTGPRRLGRCSLHENNMFTKKNKKFISGNRYCLKMERD